MPAVVVRLERPNGVSGKAVLRLPAWGATLVRKPTVSGSDAMGEPVAQGRPAQIPAVRAVLARMK
jgi:hypothetical protein